MGVNPLTVGWATAGEAQKVTVMTTHSAIDRRSIFSNRGIVDRGIVNRGIVNRDTVDRDTADSGLTRDIDKDLSGD